jgi:hypothetical protein
MRKVTWRDIVSTLFLMTVFLFLVGTSNAEVLNLKATWIAPTLNADGTPCTDLAKYKVYRTDVARVSVCEVLHPTLTCNFSVTVANDKVGVVSFVATALDTSGNESKDSNTIGFSWNSIIIPNTPGTFKIERQ